MSFVDSVLYYTQESESPRRYYYWSALSAMAAVIKDNVYIDRGVAGKVYPNIYVLLVGRSGLRKGPPVNLARHLVHSVNNTNIFQGRVSIQGVISKLGRAKTSPNGGGPKIDSSAFLVAGEFASFIIMDPMALTILTDLYDRHYNELGWNYVLRNSPEETLERPTISMLGASNEVHLKDALPQNAIGGGFLARTFVVYADKKARKNSGMDESAVTIPLSVLVQQLHEISKVKGVMKFTAPARDLYKTWYDKYQDLAEIAEDQTGTMERLHDHILKVAILVSLSRKQDMIIELNDIKEAIQVCQSLVPAARRVNLMQAGKARSAPGTAVLLNELITHPEHRISRSECLRKHWSHFSAQELDNIAEDLYAQKAIQIASYKGEPFYVLNPKVLKNFEQMEKKADI